MEVNRMIRIGACIALFCTFISAYAQEEALPELTEQMARNALLMAYSDLENLELKIINVSIDGESALVRFTTGSILLSRKFELVKTDVGRFWQIKEQSRTETITTSSETRPEASAEIKEPEVSADSGPDWEETDPFSIRTPLEIPKSSFQSVIQEFLEVARAGDREQLASYYFKASDFNWANVSEEDEDPRTTLQNGATEFMLKAEQIAAVLRNAESYEILSYITSRSNAMERAMLRQIMPRASRYIKEIVVELIVDNEPARLTLEGVTYVGSGWRIGSIAEMELPQPLP